MFNDDLHALAARMLELMREHKGVGLAAPQVGKNIRLFVMNPTGEPADDRVYVNPVLVDGRGRRGSRGRAASASPTSTSNISRAKQMRMQAQDLDGKPIEEVGRRVHHPHLAARDRSPDGIADHRPHGPRRQAWPAAAR